MAKTTPKGYGKTDRRLAAKLAKARTEFARNQAGRNSGFRSGNGARQWLKDRSKWSK